MFKLAANVLTVFWLSIALMLGQFPLAAGATPACVKDDTAKTSCACARKCGCCVKPHESPSLPQAPALPAPTHSELAWALPVQSGGLILPAFAANDLSLSAPAVTPAATVPIYQRDCSYLI
jgi:hypothetical protein